MPGLGFPVPFWCSDSRRFCSLCRSEHDSERLDLISEHYVSSLISRSDLLTDAPLSALIYSLST
jgi:hypothetical protein